MALELEIGSARAPYTPAWRKSAKLSFTHWRSKRQASDTGAAGCARLAAHTQPEFKPLAIHFGSMPHHPWPATACKTLITKPNGPTDGTLHGPCRVESTPLLRTAPRPSHVQAWHSFHMLGLLEERLNALTSAPRWWRRHRSCSAPPCSPAPNSAPVAQHRSLRNSGTLGVGSLRSHHFQPIQICQTTHLDGVCIGFLLLLPPLPREHRLNLINIYIVYFMTISINYI